MSSSPRMNRHLTQPRDLIRVGQMRLAKTPESRRSNRELPAADQGAVDGDREEDVRIPYGIVVKEIAGGCPELIDIERPSSKGDHDSELALFVALSPEREKGEVTILGVREQRSGERRERRRLIVLPVKSAQHPVEPRDLHSQAGARTGGVFRDGPREMGLADAPGQGEPLSRFECVLNIRGSARVDRRLWPSGESSSDSSSKASPIRRDIPA
jgi:hypothetical protein